MDAVYDAFKEEYEVHYAEFTDAKKKEAIENLSHNLDIF